MSKRIDMSWEAMFDVRPSQDVKFGQYYAWNIVNIHNGAIIGTYRDQRFAMKQARHKYKKFIQLLEKSFTSKDPSTDEH